MPTSTRCGRRSTSWVVCPRRRSPTQQNRTCWKRSAAGARSKAVVKAYAFLGADSTSYVTGLRWPSPGTWTERDDDAIRACEPADFVWWLDGELWEVELNGEVRDLGRALTAPRARLVHRIEEWTDS